MARLVLWSLVICSSFFFAGHLYELIVLVPNWSSGTPEEVGRYRDFLAHSGPGTYFGYVGAALFVLALAAVAVHWQQLSRRRWLSAAPLALLVLYGIWTTAYFVPINQYVGRQIYDATVLKQLVDGWVFWEYPRAGLLAALLVASIALLEGYREHVPRPVR